MLRNIKCDFSIQYLFFHIFERRKYKIVKYNNSYKKILDLAIIDYKKFSGRYIEYETKDKDKGKEYDSFTNEIVFEGEYKNGERSGKGKEYDKFGNLIFDGEWKSGKRWNVKKYLQYSFMKNELKEGKGYLREFSKQSINRYEGDYSNGERNGKGKEYFSNELIFEGEYLNGNRWNGKRYDKSNNLIYELKNGKA